MQDIIGTNENAPIGSSSTDLKGCFINIDLALSLISTTNGVETPKTKAKLNLGFYENKNFEQINTLICN